MCRRASRPPATTPASSSVPARGGRTTTAVPTTSPPSTFSIVRTTSRPGSGRRAVFDRLKAACARVADRITHRRFRARYRLARLSRAWAYFRDHLDADAAQRVMLDCEYSAGWHPLLVLTVEDTLADAREV